LRIAFHSIAFPPSTGGVERFGETLARWLIANGHEVVVMTSTPGDSEADFQVLRGASLGEMTRVMRSADVVHVSGLSAKGIGLAVAAGRRPLVTHHGYQAVCPAGVAWSPTGRCIAGPKPGPCGVCPERGVRGVLGVTAHRRAARLARASVYASRALLTRIGLPGMVIYNPVVLPPRTQTRAEEGGDEIAFAGRLVREKGLDVLLRALALVPGARLSAAGDGPMRGEWERLADELGVASRTTFLGQRSVEEVAELFARSTVVCVPSVWMEAFGYAAAEAMAIGRPVVGLPTGSLPELLAEGRGFIADAVSSGALAATLTRALGDPEACRRAAGAARRFALRELSPELVGARYLEVYER
jgi:glycosyltransferase involved in cell wall biosynthesis